MTPLLLWTLTATLAAAPSPRATLSGPAGERLRVAWRGGQALLEDWQVGDATGYVALWSSVGPMTAVRRREVTPGDHRTYAWDALEQRVRGGYVFDLARWLGESGQIDRVPPGLTDDQLATFAIDDWWPDHDLVAVRIATRDCRVVPAICELATSRVLMRPPPEWRIWLDEALAGRGQLRTHLAGRVAGVDDPVRARAFAALLAGDVAGSAVLVGRRRRDVRRVITGYEDQPRVEICVDVTLVLSASLHDLDAPGRPTCLHQPVPAGFSPAAPRRALPGLGPPGGRVLVVARDVVERERAADLFLRLTRRRAAMLAEVWPAAAAARP